MISLNICRICEKQAHLVDISLHPNYTEQYLIMGDVSYDIDDGLPQFFCRLCITQLIHFVKFKQMCEETYKKLQNVLLKPTNVEIKTEFYNDYQNDWYFMIEKTEPMMDDLNFRATETEPNQNGDENVSMITHQMDLDNTNNETNSLESENLQQPDNTSTTKMMQILCDICETEIVMPVENISKLELHMSTFHGVFTNLRQCEQCGNNSNWFTSDKLQQHYAKAHKKSFKCKYCEKTHINEDKPYKCEYCGKYFYKKPHFFRHILKHTGKSPLKCKYCDKYFSQVCLLVEHFKTHAVKRQFKCEYCGKYYLNKSSLVRHSKRHNNNKKLHKCIGHIQTEEKLHKCRYCEKSYIKKIDLIAHGKTHNDEKPYKCEFCDMCYLHKSNLVAHIRTHTGEKPYICEYCEKGFYRKQSLCDHVRTHTGEKPYKCEYCSKCFSQRLQFRRHLKSNREHYFPTSS